jgi:hypothetical protein
MAKWREENHGKEFTFDIIDSLAKSKENDKQKITSQICNSAEDYLDRGRLKSKKEDFDKAIQLDPENKEV